MKLKLSILFSLLCASGTASADFEPFQVQDIRVEGLQRVEPGVVFRNLPLSAGETVDQADLSRASRKLFASGYFNDLELRRDGDVLVLDLKERPAVSLIRIEGNDAIQEEALLAGLKQSGLQEGDVFKRSTLSRIQQDLARVYASQGRYNANIQTEVEQLPGNRVALNISIKEGKIARIGHLNIIGNTQFDDDELLDMFELQLPGFWTFYTGKDRYAREKLAGDLERLRAFYMDRGYINFKIDSVPVSLSPDRKTVFITVNISEGEQFSIRDVGVAGDMVVPQEELEAGLKVKAGDIFSRRAMTDDRSYLQQKLGDAGYLFASINPVPKLNEDNTVSLKYFIDPDRRINVRRINIKGNSRTSDEVIRREMRQMEAAVASSEKIDNSKQRLDRTGYFSNVNVETQEVPGTQDQVDLTYTVTEQQSGQLTASAGFSQSEGFILNFGIQQDNFLGTGKQVGFQVANSDTNTEYSFNYLDPYYTVDGVSRGFDVYYRQRDFEEDDISSYTTDNAGASVTFGYPMDEYQRLSFSFALDQISINSGTETSQEVKDYLDTNGNDYTNFTATLGWRENRLNRGLFPTDGFSQSASVELALPGSDLTYYRANYDAKVYQPINDSGSWAMGLKGRVGYAGDMGDNEYPFFKNFFAGGLRSVRGFENNSLGPRDSEDDPFGGNVLLAGSAELIFPAPFAEENSRSVRTLLFLDAGNVFDTSCGVNTGGDCQSGIEFSEIRYSAGVGLSWITPIGPLSFALSNALNDKDGDETETFQFALGRTF